jgi:hypothetical protein
MAERHKQGLCYNCDELYVHGHRCACLFFLEAADYIVEEPDDAPAPATTPAFDPEEPLISLSAITGIRAKDTMQMRVHVVAHEFTALLDSGSTHNFVGIAAAQRANLGFQDSRGAHVTVANGDSVACHGLARDVAVRVGDDVFSVDCYAIPLDCHDMVLGVVWLRTLGPILWDFDALYMTFIHQGCRIQWRGVGSARPGDTSMGHVHAAQVHVARGTEPALLERLLEEYADIFASPTGLPPVRPCEHRIHLKLNTEPVTVRPYCYPQL